MPGATPARAAGDPAGRDPGRRHDAVRLAAQSSARITDAFSASTRPTDAAEMTRALRSLATRAERALAAIAERAGVRSTFEVVRGRAAPEILAAAAKADLVCLGRVSWCGGRGARLGATAGRLVAEAPRPVLLVRSGISAPNRAVVLLDGTSDARRALSVAGDVARGPGAEVVVLLAARREAAREHLRRYLAAHLDAAGPTAELREMEHASAEAVARSAAGAVLVLSRTPHERVTRLLGRVEGPVIVVG